MLDAVLLRYTIEDSLWASLGLRIVELERVRKRHQQNGNPLFVGKCEYLAQVRLGDLPCPANFGMVRLLDQRLDPHDLSRQGAGGGVFAKLQLHRRALQEEANRRAIRQPLPPRSGRP